MKKTNLTKLSFLTLLFALPLAVLAQTNNVEAFKGKQYMLVSNEWHYFNPEYQELQRVIADELTIKFKSSATNTEIVNFETQNNLTLLRTCLGYRDYAYTVTPSNVFQNASSLQTSPLIDYINIGVYGKFLSVPNDPAYPQMWYADAPNNVDLNLPAAWDLMQGNTDGVIVAVIDGGLDASHFDLGLGNDSYQNIYLNPGEDAWANPNDPTTGNGVDEDGNGFVDDWKGWSFTDMTNDPLNGTNPNANRHGTNVSTVLAAKVNNNYGLAGIAGDPNRGGAKLILLSVQGLFGTNSNVVDDAIVYAVDMGAKIINMSFATGNSQDIENALQYAEAHNVVVVCAAGQGGTVISYPANHPLTIAVGGYNSQGIKYWDGISGFHLDATAPGENVFYSPQSGVISSSDGTSFAAPIASGVAALMLAANPCMSPQMVKETLQATAIKSGGYNYNWEEDKPGHSKEMGYGRIDAEAAVQAAFDLKNPSYDLSIRDRIDDIGANSGYQWTWNFDQSPDIWLRNTNDGFINQFQEHFFEYSSTDIRYVYVRVTNRGCAPSLGGELVKVYFAAAGVNASWPWGSSGYCNNVLPSVTLPILQPGESTIVELVFDPANYLIDCNVNHCFMARIENSGGDVIIDHPNDLGQDIYVNNNIAMRNVVFYDIVPGINPPVYEDVQYPHGSFVSFGNAQDVAANYDLILNTSSYERDLFEVAEISLKFDVSSWEIIHPILQNLPNIEIKDDYSINVKTNELIIPNIPFPANSNYQVYCGFSFLTDEIDAQKNFEMHFLQKKSLPSFYQQEAWTGGMHFYIQRGERVPFNADAGNPQEIDLGETLTLIAENIGEYAIYNWYDQNGDLVYSGQTFEVTPDFTRTYTLEVIANADGFKDYAQVEVNVRRNKINSISPNPGSTLVNLDYEVSEVNSAYIIIIGVNTNAPVSNYILDVNQNNLTLDVSNYLNGLYSVILICDGEIVDFSNFEKY